MAKIKQTAELDGAEMGISNFFERKEICQPINSQIPPAPIDGCVRLSQPLTEIKHP